jgi:hypothetical protein
MHRTLIGMLILGSGLLAGCSQQNRGTPGDIEMAAWVDLMAPRAIEVQSFTQPVSQTGNGAADAIEVILAADDATGHPIKVVGIFQFELYERRVAGGLMMGDRLAYWRVPVRSQEQQQRYWDEYARYYRFPLEKNDLPAGEYILQAQFTGPTGEHLFDQFVIRFDGASAPPLQTRF